MRCNGPGQAEARHDVRILREIGTLEWTRRTNGILGRGERARYVAAAMLAQSRAAPRLLAYRAGIGRGGGDTPDPAELAPPDSRVAREAVEECTEVMPRSFVEHSYRSYIFARALGALDGVDCDEEVLFVGAMYHDTGAVEPDTSDGGRCFTLRGAELAEARLGGPGDGRARAAAEAVTLHINPAVEPDQGDEARLLHDGVLLDAVGLYAWDLDQGLIAAARDRHPRLRFTQEGIGSLRVQAKAIPGCRIETAFRCGFGLAARLGPWQD